jgi:hypothetical protein
VPAADETGTCILSADTGGSAAGGLVASARRAVDSQAGV